MGIKANFVRSNLNTYYVDGEPRVDAEDRWSRIEGNLLPLVRKAMRTAIDPLGRTAVRELMAMQVARSAWFQAFHATREAAAMADLRERVVVDPEAIAAYVEDFGSTPGEGEMEALVDELLAKRARSGTIRVEMMEWIFGRFLEKTSEFEVEIAHTLGGPVRFITSDTPVIISRKLPDGTIKLGVALNDADTVAMPLGPTVYAALSREPGFGYLDSRAVRLLNRVMWTNAQEAVALHPADSLQVCLGVSPSWRPPQPLGIEPTIIPPPRGDDLER